MEEEEEEEEEEEDRERIEEESTGRKLEQQQQLKLMNYLPEYHTRSTLYMKNSCEGVLMHGVHDWT